jgi:uncharacterized protein YggE
VCNEAIITPCDNVDFRLDNFQSFLIAKLFSNITNMPSTVPFVLEVQGKAVIPHPAERAHVNVHIKSSGLDKAAVANDVLTSARLMESLLKELSASDESAEAFAAAALAHWSKTSLSSTSNRPYENGKRTDAEEYTAQIDFDIRFKNFKALGGFGARISALPHVELRNIEWKLTAATENHFRSELRKKAASDAFRKAQDYCEVFGCLNLQPVALAEGHTSLGSMGIVEGAIDFDRSDAGGAFQAPAGFGASQSRNMQVGFFSADAEDEVPEFEFTPQEIKMDMTVTVKFKAE